jgi:integrase
MKGSIKKDSKSGKYYFVVDVGKDPVTGKRIQKRKRGFTEKKDAEIALAKMIFEFENEMRFRQSEASSFDKYMKDWFIERKGLVERTTLNNNLAFYKYYIYPALGKLKFDDITPQILQNFANDLYQRGSLATGTIHKIFDIIKVALNKAVKMKIIKENPSRYVDLPKLRKKEIKVWELEQINQFIQEIKAIRNDDQFFTAYLLAISCGMRQGEILGLRWNDINFSKKLIFIRQTLSHDAKEFKPGAKTNAGVRTINITQSLCDQLLFTKEKILKDKQKLGNKYQDYDLVVCNKKGSPLHPSNLLKTFKDDTRKVGLPVISFHELRHSHATMLIQQDISPKLIQERLGHSRIGITLDTYSHVLPSMQREVADKLDKMIVI